MEINGEETLSDAEDSEDAYSDLMMGRRLVASSILWQVSRNKVNSTSVRFKGSMCTALISRFYVLP